MITDIPGRQVVEQLRQAACQRGRVPLPTPPPGAGAQELLADHVRDVRLHRCVQRSVSAATNRACKQRCSAPLEGRRRQSAVDRLQNANGRPVWSLAARQAGQNLAEQAKRTALHGSSNGCNGSGVDRTVIDGRTTMQSGSSRAFDCAATDGFDSADDAAYPELRHAASWL